jgi:hypothetical protein
MRRTGALERFWHHGIGLCSILHLDFREFTFQTVG